MLVKHRVAKEIRHAAHGFGVTVVDHRIDCVDVAGAEVGAECGPQVCDVPAVGGLVAGDRDRVGIDVPDVDAALERRCHDRSRAARHVDLQGVEIHLVADLDATTAQPLGQDSRAAMRATRNVGQALRPVVDRVHRGGHSEQDLRGADVAGRLLAPDVLLTSLQREPVRGPPFGVNREPDEPPRQ